jgi:hypothetical protein
LLHIHFFDAQGALERLGEHIDPVLFDVTGQAHLESLEYAIDAIALSMCDLFPDPPAIIPSGDAVADFFILEADTENPVDSLT